MDQWAVVGAAGRLERPRHGVAGAAPDRRADWRCFWGRGGGRPKRGPWYGGGAAHKNGVAHLWLIRHAPVDGPREVIHGPEAPADISDAEAFSALKARLPPGACAVCSPARRTRETAL